ncbi:hypothetical protein [uncultured Lamprocystis sp.]|jgi:hypothetical protein|uniref:hypothetical protein n=1 Tax=uncultured Lamprocystis sp. TaxID=543132 RepID=UPI0025F992C8|nr:hypothetical protein [uncultured Lamprocystis sp.]
MADLLKSIAGVLELTGLKSSLATVRKQYNAAQGALEALKREREEIAAAPLTRVDLIDGVDRWADSMADDYRKKLGTLLMSARHPARAGKLFTQEDHFRKMLLGHEAHGGSTNQSGPGQEAFVWLLGPEAIKNAFRSVIEALPIDNEGLPLVERRARLKELDHQLGKAEAALSELRRDAAAAGISFDAKATDDQIDPALKEVWLLGRNPNADQSGG